MTSVAIINKELICEQLAAGRLVSAIAKDLGYTSHAAISARLANDPDYLAAREAGLEARLEQRENDLEAAEDSVTVARTRELLSHQRWRCEREAPARWAAPASRTAVQVGDGDKTITIVHESR